MSPIALDTYGEWFIEAARSLPMKPAPPNGPFDPVQPYLDCHSIELCLKAFLCLHGMTMIDLAEGRYGHNLEIVLDMAKAKNLLDTVPLTVEHEKAIHDADNYYASKIFEYPAILEAIRAYSNMPSIEPLFEAATILVDSLRQVCGKA